MLHLFRPVKIWRHYDVRHYPLIYVGLFRNYDNQVNIGDPIEDIMINEYHTIHLGLLLTSSLLLEYSSEYLNEYSSTR